MQIKKVIFILILIILVSHNAEGQFSSLHIQKYSNVNKVQYIDSYSSGYVTMVAALNGSQYEKTFFWNHYNSSHSLLWSRCIKGKSFGISSFQIDSLGNIFATIGFRDTLLIGSDTFYPEYENGYAVTNSLHLKISKFNSIVWLKRIKNGRGSFREISKNKFAFSGFVENHSEPMLIDGHAVEGLPKNEYYYFLADINENGEFGTVTRFTFAFIFPIRNNCFIAQVDVYDKLTLGKGNDTITFYGDIGHKALVKYNSNLDIIWVKQFKGSYISRIIESEDGSLYMCGSYLDLKYDNIDIPIGGQGIKGYLAKLNQTGDLIWFKYVNSTVKVNMDEIFQINNLLVCSGYFEGSFEYESFSASSPTAKTFVATFDSTGELLQFDQTTGNGNATVIFSAKEDNTIYLFGEVSGDEEACFGSHCSTEHFSAYVATYSLSELTSVSKNSSESNWIIYPNPASNEITIDFTGELNTSYFELYDQLGQLCTKLIPQKKDQRI